MKELSNFIISSEVEYDDAWRGLSEECGDFVKRLLTRNTKERMSSDAALKHPWIVKSREVNLYISNREYLILNISIIKKIQS